MKKTTTQTAPKSNGKSPALAAVQAPPPAAPADSGVIQLTESEIESLKQLDAGMVRVKMDLANACLEIQRLEDLKKEIVAKLKEQGDLMMGMVRTYARTHGIDPDADPANGRWQFNLEDCTFRSA